MNHIRHILWDLDGVFFRHTPEYQTALHQSLARHIETAYGLPYAEALDMADHGQLELKSCFTPFMECYGLEFETLAKPAYKGLDIGFMKPDAALLRDLPLTGTDHAIVTKSSLEWARRVLEQVGLSDHFPDRNILACADFPGFNKADGPAVYEHALTLWRFDPRETLMVEDSQRNLKHAKALGLTTVLVHSGEAQAEYTDHAFAGPADFLQAFIRSTTL